MKHADKLMDRILMLVLMLDALPNLQHLGKLMIVEDVPEALVCDLKAEQEAQATLNEGTAHCESVPNFVSRELPQGILDDTDEHIDSLETQLALVQKVGFQYCLHSQMGALD